MGLWDSVWDEEAHAHGPLIFAVIVWIVWRRRTARVALPAPGRLTF